MRTLPQQVLIASITATALVAGEPRAAEPTPTRGAVTTAPACDVIAARVRDLVAEQAWTSIEEITPDARFVDDLGFDSLDTLELVMAIEEEFELEIRDEDAEKITTVGEATDYLRARLNCKR